MLRAGVPGAYLGGIFWGHISGATQVVFRLESSLLI